MPYKNIVEGLKCCTQKDTYLLCPFCPYREKDDGETDCCDVLMEDALLLIEQQSNLIEHLQSIQDKYLDTIMEEN